MGRAKAEINLWDTATALATTASITSAPIYQGRGMGYGSLLVIVTGAAPSLDITQTVGKTPTDTFYEPYDSAGTSLGSIYSALTTTRRFQFAPALSSYLKITITGTATNGVDTTIRAYYTFEEDL